MKFLEIIVIVVPSIMMFTNVFLVATRTTITDYETHIAIIISGLISWGIAYYFHRKDTPAQKTWNKKRKETMEDLLDLFEQLSRNVRVGANIFDKATANFGYSEQMVSSFITQQQTAFRKISDLRSLIEKSVDRNYNYLTNKETRLFKMNADAIIQYLEMKLHRPTNYLSKIEYLENKHTITGSLSQLFREVSVGNKEFLEFGIFSFRNSDLDPRWENTHQY